jgi:hypothetical protein
MWSQGAVAGLREAIRRSRENPRPDLGPPDLPEVIAEVVATLAETYAALRVARQEMHSAGLSLHAEPVAGRYGELAAQVAEWANTATEIQRRVGVRDLRPGVQWGPNPGDPRVAAATALALTSTFAMASALAAMATIDDSRRAGKADADVQPIFTIAVTALWSATELATGVASCLQHLTFDGHAVPEDPLDVHARCLESERRFREALSTQLDDLGRYRPAGEAETRRGFVLMVRRVDEDLELLDSELGRVRYSG